MSEPTVAGPAGGLTPAQQFAPTVLAHGRRTVGRPLVLTPAGAVAVAPNGARCIWQDDPERPGIYRFKDRVVLADVDSAAEHRTVAHLLAEREDETGWRAHVAWHTGGVTDGYRHLTVVIYDPDLEWRRRFMSELHRAHPRTARWGNQLTRPPGGRSAKVGAEAPDGGLHALTARGVVAIDLAEAKRRVRKRGGSQAEVPKAGAAKGAEFVDVPPYRTRPAPRSGSSRSTRSGSPASLLEGASIAALVALLPTWAQVAAAVDAPIGARSEAELDVCRGAAMADLDAVDLHRLLCVVAAGGRWRATGGSVARADARLRAARRWLNEHPGGHVVDEAVRACVVASWDAVLADAAAAGLPATRWVVLLRHRALAIAEGGWSWLGSVRDLGVGVDRKVLPKVRDDLAPWVAVESAGEGGRGREATLWRVAERWQHESVDVPHESAEWATRMRSFADQVVELVAGDLWAPTTGIDRRAASAETALLIAALKVGMPLADLRAMTGVASLRHWTTRAAALGLITRSGQRSPWRLGDDPGVAADRLGATGRAAAQDAAKQHERAVHAELVGLVAAGRSSEVGQVHARERARTAAKTGRPINPGRRGQRPGDTEITALWEDEALGIAVGLTSRDLREGAAPLVAAWTARWVDGGAAERRAVHASIEAWKAMASRAGAAQVPSSGPVRPAAVIRPWSDADAVSENKDCLEGPLALCGGCAASSWAEEEVDRLAA
jgi:hypothetical protein